MFSMFQIKMKTIIITNIIVIVYFNIVMGTPLHPLHHNEHYMNRMQQFCGQHLTRELDILCGGDYYDPNGKYNFSIESIMI
jgi:hypothetical protein